MKIMKYSAALLLSSASVLTGCGGGSAAVGVVAAAPACAAGFLCGTAASGAPITGNVVAIDALGQIFPATQNPSAASVGAYTINVAGGTAPFVLSVVGTVGGKSVSLTSIATGAGQTVNITPLTDMVVSAAAGQPAGGALVSACQAVAPSLTAPAACTTALTQAIPNLAAATASVTSMVSGVPGFPAGANVNVMNTPFTANATGLDKVLDQILVTPAAAQAGMSTVTLISVPNAPLGTATLPAAPGTAATTTVTAPSVAAIAQATAANTALTEIKACTASLNALYPATMVTPPTAAQVTPYVDATFSLQGLNLPAGQAQFITMLSSTPVAGGVAVPNLGLQVSAYSPFDFTPQTTTALAKTMAAPATRLSPVTFDPVTGAATAAWVQLGITSQGGTFMNWKFVKGATYPGCASGWKVAGDSHIDMHMHARVSQWNPTLPVGALPQYTRYLPFHVNTNDAVAQGAGSITFEGPGLAVFGTALAPVGALTPVTVVVPPVPAPPAVQQSWLAVADTATGTINAFYGNPVLGTGMEAIQSCQDLAAIAAPAPVPAAGTPCYDETAVAPGAVFTATVHAPAVAPAVGAVLYAFNYEIGAVPLSNAFVAANAANLFPSKPVVTPASVAALNAAAAAVGIGAPLDNIISFSYTVPTTYGTRADHCNIGLVDATGTIVLMAEARAASQTSCVFTTAALNMGSLAKPAVPFAAAGPAGNTGYVQVGSLALGNQLGSMHPYQ